MTRMLLAGASALVFSTGVAWAECSPENWQDCAGKPWVDGDKMETPLGSQWWPHPIWGEGDEAGSTNWYKDPEVVLRAVSQIKEGKTYELGHEYHADMPLFGVRKFTLRIPGTPTGGPFGANNLVYNDEFLSTEIGQVGTQFDGLGHIGVQIGTAADKSEMRWYNGFTAAEIGDAYGLQHLGTEKLHPIVARGILLDIPGALGVEALEAGHAVSMDEVNAALENQGMADFEFQPGDAILFRYGWETHWDDPAKFNDGQPGISVEVARWVAEEVQAGVTGHDSWAGDPTPYPDPACVFCVHTFLQTRHGIVNQENLRLKQLADDGTYVFAYIYGPAPIRGATGSIGSPIAIK